MISEDLTIYRRPEDPSYRLGKDCLLTGLMGHEGRRKKSLTPSSHYLVVVNLHGFRTPKWGRKKCLSLKWSCKLLFSLVHKRGEVHCKQWKLPVTVPKQMRRMHYVSLSDKRKWVHLKEIQTLYSIKYWLSLHKLVNWDTDNDSGKKAVTSLCKTL